MVEKQRRMASDGNIVVEGRDIGTVVFPQADLKVYLMASAEERSHRRHRQLGERGEAVEYETIRRDLRRRDDIDSQRASSPLRPAEDARIIHTDKLDIEGVVDEIMHLVGEG
jgi:cytidylate kinase